MKLSVVVPCYNEAQNITPLFAALVPVLAKLTADFEVVCVDDGSTDETAALIRQASKADARIRLLRFARNFGKEAALTAGIDHVEGDAVVLMDADLQHPPTAIAQLVEAWRAGADMVIAARVNRDTDAVLRRVLTGAFYRLFNAMSKVEVTMQTGDFRLLDRRAIAAMQALPERNRFMKGLYALVGLRVASVPYVPEWRHSGGSQFGFKRLWRFAIDGLASFTSVPLRVWSYVGFAIAVPAGIYAAYFVARTLIYGVDLPGYASLATMILFFSGVQLISLGILGEYVGRVYDEAKQRPLYVVSETVGEFAPLPKLAHGGIRLPDRKYADSTQSEAG